MTRTASEIGAGLAPARAPRAIRPGERIHVVGAAGAGASAAALLAHAAGAAVTGCDVAGPSPYTPALDRAGIPVALGHAVAHVSTEPSPERLAVTKALTAIEPDHPELLAARARGIPEEPWQQTIADAATGKLLVAVAGTHGKSTSAGWLTHVLAACGADPSAFVGALLSAALTGGVASTARSGRGAHFVVEADEYAGNFDPYRPRVVLLTNIEWDHPDVFADRAEVVAAFARWLRGITTAAAPPTIVANLGDPGVLELLEKLGPDEPEVIGFVVEGADGADTLGGATRSVDGAESNRRDGRTPSRAPGRIIRGRTIAAERDGTRVEIDGLAAGDGFDPAPRAVTLPTAGRHNVANALGVAATAEVLGIAADQVVAALATFEGVGRRLERKGEAGGVVVFDDYGHHPTAIRETMAAIRQREPGRRLWAVYEPLTFHRTAALADAFADVLATADAVAIADIWAGRDPDSTVASSGDLAGRVRARREGITAEAPGSVEATAAWLASRVVPGDVVLVMGGGRSYRIAELLLEILEARGG
jgi:UDP-N-acetylmuramate--alanine ligase